MDVSEWIATIVGTGGFLAGVAALLSYFRPKAVEARRLGMEEDRTEVDLAAANLNLAKGTVEFVKETYEAQVARVLSEQAALQSRLAEREREEAQYRADVENRLAELAAAVRSEKAEKHQAQRERDAVAAENVILRAHVSDYDRLRNRVDELEAEVRRLKSGRP